MQRSLAQRSADLAVSKVFRVVAAVAPVLVLLRLASAHGRSAVHSYEPLRSGAEDDRILASPAVRVAMLVVFRKEQHAAFAHELYNLRISFKNTLARKVFNVGHESSGIINRAINLKPVLFANHEVVVPVPRRCVNATR